MLSVEKIHSYYGQAHILSDVSLELAPGEIVVLIGRNGAGKSTTIKSIMGMVKVTVPPPAGTAMLPDMMVVGAESVRLTVAVSLPS